MKLLPRSPCGDRITAVEIHRSMVTIQHEPMHEMTQTPPMPHAATLAREHGSAPRETDTAVKTKLSIVIPVYNEFATIETLIDMVVRAPLPPGVTRQIICVNDCSTDGTHTKLDKLPER